MNTYIIDERKWSFFIATLILLLGFSIPSCNSYRSAKQEKLNAQASDSLAKRLASQAGLMAKTEPDLALKVIKELYRITDQNPPAEVKQTLAGLFYEQLKLMPVLVKEFDIQGNLKELSYSEEQQAYIIYMKDEQVMLWEESMSVPKAFSSSKISLDQISPSAPQGSKQDLSKTAISPSKQYLLSYSKQDLKGAYIKNQAGEILGFFSSREKISYASFGENDHSILTISTEGEARLWALNRLAKRKESAWNSEQLSLGESHPSFVKTENGLKLIGKDREILKELELEKAFDKMEISNGAERILTYQEWQNQLYCWDMDGNLLQTIEHEDEISEVSISSDGHFAIVLTYQEPTSGRVYDLRTGQLHLPLDTLLADGLMIAGFSPGLPYMITHIEQGLTVGIWDFNGSLKKAFAPNGLVERLYFSPKGNYFHTQAIDKDGQIWDQNGNLLGTTDKNIHLLEFSADESRIYYLIYNGDDELEKWSLPTVKRFSNYLMEDLALPNLTDEEKIRFGL